MKNNIKKCSAYRLTAIMHCAGAEKDMRLDTGHALIPSKTFR